MPKKGGRQTCGARLPRHATGSAVMIELQMPHHTQCPLTDGCFAYRSSIPSGPASIFATTTTSESRGDLPVRSLPSHSLSQHSHIHFIAHRVVSRLPWIPMLTGMRLPRSAGSPLRTFSPTCSLGSMSRSVRDST